MDFWFTIIIVLFELVAIAAYIIYFMADNAHPEDTDFGKSIFCRVMIFLGFLSAYSSMLMVQVDVLQSDHPDVSRNVIEILWIFVILIQIAFVYIVSPLMLVYYQSNENDKFVRRIWTSFRAQLPLFVVLILIIVPTYFSKLSYYNLPEEIAVSYNVPAYARMDFILHVYTVTCWIG
jgi:LMBR1 domain-containing protein 1